MLSLNSDLFSMLLAELLRIVVQPRPEPGHFTDIRRFWTSDVGKYRLQWQKGTSYTGDLSCGTIFFVKNRTGNTGVSDGVMVVVNEKRQSTIECLSFASHSGFESSPSRTHRIDLAPGAQSTSKLPHIDVVLEDRRNHTEKPLPRPNVYINCETLLKVDMCKVDIAYLGKVTQSSYEAMVKHMEDIKELRIKKEQADRNRREKKESYQKLLKFFAS